MLRKAVGFCRISLYTSRSEQCHCYRTYSLDALSLARSDSPRRYGTLCFGQEFMPDEFRNTPQRCMDTGKSHVCINSRLQYQPLRCGNVKLYGGYADWNRCNTYGARRNGFIRSMLWLYEPVIHTPDTSQHLEHLDTMM
eukprot:9296033-Pyramimonas_sp.AAC.3